MVVTTVSVRELSPEFRKGPLAGTLSCGQEPQQGLQQPYPGSREGPGETLGTRDEGVELCGNKAQRARGMVGTEGRAGCTAQPCFVGSAGPYAVRPV